MMRHNQPSALLVERKPGIYRGNSDLIHHFDPNKRHERAVSSRASIWIAALLFIAAAFVIWRIFVWSVSIVNTHIAEPAFNELASIFALIHELRPHLEEATFFERIKAAQLEGYRLVVLYENGTPVSAVGFRIYTMLHSARTLYIDDLITTASHRGKGYAKQLFQFAVEEGRRENCAMLTLDSGYHRRDAHRFYLNQQMAMVSHHFSLKL